MRTRGEAGRKVERRDRMDEKEMTDFLLVDMGSGTCARAAAKAIVGDIGAWVDWISACVGVLAPGSSQRFELCHTLRPAGGGSDPPACRPPKYPCPICR
jgi:hypothetical protein